MEPVDADDNDACDETLSAEKTEEDEEEAEEAMEDVYGW